MRTKLQPGETVALVVRKHWVVLLKPALFLTAVCLYVPVRHVKILGFEALLNYLLPYAAALSGVLFLYRYLDRRLNIWAVTDRRLIDEWGILTHRCKENPLDKINDIVVEETILGRIFGYGSISVQTAATAGETVIEFVERPEELKQTINAQKAMTAERPNGSDFFPDDHQRHMGDSQTVLLHESAQPPFSLRCPHCDGKITIEYDGSAKGDLIDAMKTQAHQEGQVERDTPIMPPLEGRSKQSPADKMPSLTAPSEAAADPFGWKKRPR